MKMAEHALSVRGLTIRFQNRDRPAPVVNNLSLDLPAGQITGMAGESGSGKTLTALALLGLSDPRVFDTSLTRCTLNGQPVTPQDLVQQRGRGIAMVFQDPATALDPVFSIGSQLVRTLRRHGDLDRSAARRQAEEALSAAGFDAPAELMRRYPHELSGGMRQLCVIAMAQALRPSVLLADEPTTALDAVSQYHVLEQLRSLASEHGTAVLLITHDLRLLANTAQRVYVMYHGHLVERTTGDRLVQANRHPYTRGLVRALPRLVSPAQAGTSGLVQGTASDSTRPGVHGRARGIAGDPPAVGQAVSGCVFAPRCDRAKDQCHASAPTPTPSSTGEVACHYPLGETP